MFVLASQCSSFLPVQQVKEFFKLVLRQLEASLLIISVQCIIWNRKLPHFNPLHADSLVKRLYKLLKTLIVDETQKEVGNSRFNSRTVLLEK